MPVRLGAVSYLNARPLVYGLDRQPDRFSIRFDVPSKCAALLHENQVDLGLIPSIEYLRVPDYHVVPGIAVASDGPVGSVALFSTCAPQNIRSIAVDISSRTSVALLRILCDKQFDIHPELIPMTPDLASMTDRCNAALLIGDAALYAGHEALGLRKIDLGEQWRAMTNLPFVYAFWAGRPGVVSSRDVEALVEARDAGRVSVEELSRDYFTGNPDIGASGSTMIERIRQGADYLRNNVKYDLGQRERAGLRKFYDLAEGLRLIPRARSPQFYE